MGLTWKDVVTMVFMGAIAVVYAAFLTGTSAWLISSARGTTLAVLVLGMVGGCMLSAAGDLYRGPQSRAARSRSPPPWPGWPAAARSRWRCWWPRRAPCGLSPRPGTR